MAENREVWLLEKTYNPYLILLSICMSFLGAHTTTQSVRVRGILTLFRLICQTYTTGRIRKKVAWLSLASVMFGGWYNS